MKKIHLKTSQKFLHNDMAALVRDMTVLVR